MGEGKWVRNPKRLCILQFQLEGRRCDCRVYGLGKKHWKDIRNGYNAFKPKILWSENHQTHHIVLLPFPGTTNNMAR